MRNAFLDFESLLLSHGAEHPLVRQTLIRAGYVPIRRFVAMLLSDPHLAETVTPQILQTALEQLSSYSLGSHFTTWLLALTLQICRRRRKQWAKNLQTIASEVTPPNHKSQINTLPDDLRLPLLLRYGFDLELVEVAEILQARETVIERRVEKAFSQLGLVEGDESELRLREEIAGLYPLPPGPAEGFATLTERLTQRVGAQASSRGWRLRSGGAELGWVGLLVFLLAGVIWTFNRTETDSNTLPLYPSPTPPLPEAVVPKTQLISEHPDYESEGSSIAHQPTFSADGRFIAYAMQGENGSDIYIYDSTNRQVEGVQLASNLAGNSYNASYSPDLSANGEWIALEVHNLAGIPFYCDGSQSFCTQIVLYNREERTWEVISTNRDSEQGDGSSSTPSISADGRWVAFWSYAGNFVPNDTEMCDHTAVNVELNCGDIFLKDTHTGAIQRIRIGSGVNYAPRFDLSDNGEWLVFSLSNLDQLEREMNLMQNPADVIAYHIPTGAYHLVNVASDGTPGNASSYMGTISAEGRYVAFVSEASNLTGDEEAGDKDPDVFLHDLESGETVPISGLLDETEWVGSSGMVPGEKYSAWLSMSADGRWVVFTFYSLHWQNSNSTAICIPGQQNPNQCYRHMVYDRQTGSIKPLNIHSTNNFPPSDMYFSTPKISADGTRILLTGISWYVSGTCPEGNCSEIFLFNTETEEVQPVSHPQSTSPSEFTWQYQTFVKAEDTWVNSVAISPDGKYFASAGREKGIDLWNFVDKRILKSLSLGEKPIHALAFSADGEYLAAGDEDGNVCVFLMPSGDTYQCMADHPGAVGEIAFSPDGTMLAIASTGTVRIWRLLEQEFIHVREYPHPGGDLDAVAFSPDGALLAAPVNGQIWVRLVSSGEIIARLDGHSGKILDLAFSPNGQFLASGSDDNTSILWEVKATEASWSFSYLRTLRHREWVSAVTFSTNNDQLITGTFDSSIVLWNIPDGAFIETLRRTSQDQIMDLAISPEGDQLVAGTIRGIRMWKYGPSQAGQMENTTFFAFADAEPFVNNSPYLSPEPFGLSATSQVVATIEEAQEMVSFILRTPDIPQANLTLSGIFVFKDPSLEFEAVAITYVQTTSFQPSFLTITQSNLNPVLYDYPIGQTAQVSPAYIGPRGEYVLGGWNIANSFSDATGKGLFERFWDEELASQWLRWEESGVYFSILYDQPLNLQSIPASEHFLLEDMFAIAESLND